MKLKSRQPNLVQQPRQNLGWSNNCARTPTQQEFQPDTWVKLLELPSAYSYQEALLLCQVSQEEWVTWIPDHGEAVLQTRQFCALS